MPVLHRWNGDDDERAPPIARPSSGAAWRYDESESEGEASGGDTQPFDHKSLFRSFTHWKHCLTLLISQVGQESKGGVEQ